MSPRHDSRTIAAQAISRKLLAALHADGSMAPLPRTEAVRQATDFLLDIVLVRGGIGSGLTAAAFTERIDGTLKELVSILTREVGVERSDHRQPDAVVRSLIDLLPDIIDHVEEDIGAAMAGDPAARTREHVRLAYPGIFAITVYRLAHALLKLGCPLIARIMTEYAHERTGIDIHPGAKIGKRFFIDHGTGVVIGETSVIGDDVAIYQGVTLGAQSFPRKPDGSFDLTKKRHPTIGNHVKIYADAAILGSEKVADGSIVGSGTRLILKEDIPANTVIIPEKQVMRMKNKGA